MDVLIARTLALLGIAILVAIAARRLSLPYTVGLVLAGIGLAASSFDSGIALTHDIIFDLILPPLLFEAALNIPWRELRRDMIPVLIFSVIGVVISAAIVAAGMTVLFGWPLYSASIFGVLIAATDPVAVIAMFKDTKLGGRLRLLVESESLFNDGVAAVLFGLALGWGQTNSSGLAEASGALMTNAGGGIILGLSTGVLGVIIAGRTTDHIVEAAVTAVVAYGAFLSAEQLHVSGVLATVCAGLVMGGIGVSTRDFRFGFSSEGQTFVIELWEFAAFIANSLVFLLIGLTAGRVPFHEVGLAPLAAAIILVLLGRAATVYPLSLLFALSQWRIGFREQHVLWWAGLRGALALALVLALPRSIPQRESIVIATFGVVTFSVMVQGLTMKPLLHWLKFLPSR